MLCSNILDLSIKLVEICDVLDGFQIKLGVLLDLLFIVGNKLLHGCCFESMSAQESRLVAELL